MTPEIEPTEPFILGLLLFNRGNGTAKNLQIASSQPEIVENSKGLLIDFRIESAMLNGQQESSSLKIKFGDVYPNQFEHVIWYLTSTLKGEFKNLKVTFTNTNPNGDPKLSLIDNIEYNQLFKAVNVDKPDELKDQLLDFLTLDKYTAFPNKVYVSNYQKSELEVYYETNVTLVSFSQSVLILRLNGLNITNKWVYGFTKIKINSVKDIFVDITRNDGRVVPSEKCMDA